ncbi:S9 family peptidase [Flammeovirga kamogawensis]|uniref:S9 family peptidase n=1 Tax=Flammeovirga kamogawensis TaxID=373891 RepID=A0ABX8GXL2_9BACT|nr:DPP IV N-terminal domain-containing protein [Flammeovirga kamogawensis]MBB6460691.1 dipeptidyl-peptidase-4 [Flammeovirga kamogawensis]QWG08046.1 S9 family peptidase [Flammeovirga kamogawensis]TRX69853.1 prolyl oligopeptidase family serine peptidase [Flammeovirga kamogawensis]
MNKLYKLTAVLLMMLLTVSTVNAQKKTLTLEDAIVKRWSQFYPKHLAVQWRPDSKGYYIINEENRIVEVNAKKGTKNIILTLGGLKGSHNDLLNINRLPRYKWISKNQFTFKVENKIYVTDVTTKKSEQTTSWNLEGKHQDVTTDRKKVAYTIENNLFISIGNGEVQLTNESNKEIVFGQTVHRNEFGVNKGTYWSPKGTALAFYRNDQTMVTNYPLVDLSTRPASANPIKYPMAGQKSEEVTLKVYNTVSKKTINIKTEGPKEQYLTNVAWSPDEKSVYVGILNRDQNHLALNEYNAETGEFVKTLFEEKDSKYLSLTHPMEFLPNSNDKFIWRTEKDGFEHVYLYSTDGKQLAQITKGDWVVMNVLGFDRKNQNIFVLGTDNNGMDRQVYKANLKSKKVTKITKESGVYSGVKYDASSNLLFANFTNISTPNKEVIFDSNGKIIKTILDAKDPLADYNVSPIELSTITAADGKTVLNTRMIKPSNFDATKKYPVIMYVYGGPGVQLLTNRWQAGAALWMQKAAQDGYIIYTVESRGSENRGKDFEQATHLHLGDAEIADQLKGVDYLKTLPYVDSSKLAIHGWSFGGFMTTSLMTKSAGTFKVGVAGGPVMDWGLYEIMYTERYMSTPQKNPKGYEKSLLLDKTHLLKDKLLIIHGLIDDVVVPQHSFLFLQNCVSNGVQVDFFTYPGHPHNVRGKDRVHLMKKVLMYIDDNINR